VSLWSEIKQRRITQIVIAYLTAGWLVLAVFDQVVDREVLPPVFYEVALTLYLFGIVAALVIGWYHGEKGEQQAPKIEIVMLTVLALGALGSSGIVVRNSMAEAEIAGLVGDDLRDIAVLYLEDVSRDGSIQATADGITEGLISSLRQVNELNVSSRNASRPSPARTVTSYPRRSRRSRASTASSGTYSALYTFPGPTSSARTAAWYPQPVPTSRTRSPRSTSRRSVITATMCGALIVWSCPIGSGRSA